MRIELSDCLEQLLAEVARTATMDALRPYGRGLIEEVGSSFNAGLGDEDQGIFVGWIMPVKGTTVPKETCTGTRASVSIMF